MIYHDKPKPRKVGIPVEPDVRDRIRKEKGNLTYSEFLTSKLNELEGANSS